MDPVSKKSRYEWESMRPTKCPVCEVEFPYYQIWYVKTGEKGSHQRACQGIMDRKKAREAKPKTPRNKWKSEMWLKCPVCRVPVYRYFLVDSNKKPKRHLKACLEKA